MKISVIIFITLAINFTEYSANKAELTPKEITWISLTEAQEKSVVDGKPLFIFVEAEWCGFCKQMMNSVFPEPSVTELLTDNFHPVLIDLDSRETIHFNGEVMTERNFARSMQVQQTPTTIFIDENGEVLGSQPGFMDTDELEKLLLYVLSEQFGVVPLSEFTID